MGLKFQLNKVFILLFLIFFTNTNLLAQGNPFLQGNKPNTQTINVQNESKLQKTSRDLQKLVREKIAFFIKEVKENKNFKLIFLSLLFSFLYGVLHAIGPGHRKIVMFSYFATNKARFYEPWIAGFSISGLHAFGSVALVTIVFFIIKTSISATINQISNKMEFLSYLSIAILGAALLIIAIYNLVKKIIEFNNEIQNNNNDVKTNKRRLIFLILTTGPIPCPGATLILTMAIANNVYLFGILLVIAMSFGMSLTISILGSLAYLFKNLFTSFANRSIKKENSIFSFTHTVLEIVGAIIILVFGIFMTL